MQHHGRGGMTPLGRLGQAGLLAAAFLGGAARPIAAPPSGFVIREGTSLVCDRRPFVAVGYNCYYLMVYAAEPSLRGAVDEVLAEAKLLGATVVRTWAFNDGPSRWNALQLSPGVYDERVFRGLDYVVMKAGELGLRLLLPLVNNWDDYGGMNQYVAWSPAATRHDDFYTDASCRAWYRDHVTAVLTRANSFTGISYRDNPAVFGWELANEPRARDAGHAALNDWIAEMAAYLKAADANHLLSTGSEGFYGIQGPARNPRGWMANEGGDFIANHRHETIDFGSFHAWADHWDLTLGEAVAWARDHFQDSRAILGKPALMGEFGKVRPIATRNVFFAEYLDATLQALEPGVSSAGALAWILYHDDYPDFDGFGVYYPDPDHASTTSLLREKYAACKERIQAAPARFLRADADTNGTVGLSDPVQTLARLFRARGHLACADAADANDDGRLDISDPVYTLLFLFRGGSPPAAPFPACGVDETLEEPELGCDGSPSCAP